MSEGGAQDNTCERRQAPIVRRALRMQLTLRIDVSECSAEHQGVDLLLKTPRILVMALRFISPPRRRPPRRGRARSAVGALPSTALKITEDVGGHHPSSRRRGCSECWRRARARGACLQSWSAASASAARHRGSDVPPGLRAPDRHRPVRRSCLPVRLCTPRFRVPPRCRRERGRTGCCEPISGEVGWSAARRAACAGRARCMGVSCAEKMDERRACNRWLDVVRPGAMAVLREALLVCVQNALRAWGERCICNAVQNFKLSIRYPLFIPNTHGKPAKKNSRSVYYISTIDY